MVVAARPVERGTALARADLAVDRLPARFVAEGAFASIEQVRGRTPVVPLLAGEPVLRGHLAPDGLSGVAALLPAGGRALAVPTGSASPPLRKGDVVDVLATFDAQATATTQATVAVAVDAAIVDVGAESATVAVTVEEARAVAFALAHGSVALALTPGVSAGPSPGGRALPLPPAAGRPRTG
jgi:Flp pilus assembly protein CpaB